MNYDLGNIIILISGAIAAFFSVLTYVRVCRKPRARLRFSNGKKEISFSPHFYNITLKYYVVPYYDLSQFNTYLDLGKRYKKLHEKDNIFLLSFRLSNTGAFQLENYRIEIDYNRDECSAFISRVHHRGEIIKEVPFFDGVNFSKEKPMVILSPAGVFSPLNQNDHDDYSFQITPNVDVEKIELHWRIIAKDFSDTGKFIIHLNPIITTITNIQPVYRESEIPEGAERVEDLTPYINEYKNLLNG